MPPSGTKTVARALIDEASERLRSAGVQDPRLDAQLLLSHVMGQPRPRVITGLTDDPTTDERTEFERLVDRRARREPLAYITGFKGFRRIELAVDSRVLIPRSETELLVAVVKVGRPCGILDVGTGSGAVALALADELPDATIHAVDISTDALEVARANSERLGLEVSFGKSDLLDAVTGEFDAIAANLPYVTTGELAELQPEITDFEPALALDGGSDGLNLVRRLAAAAPVHLKPRGLLALEIGDAQGAATEQILRDAGFTATAVHQDLTGRDRVVTGEAPAR